MGIRNLILFTAIAIITISCSPAKVAFSPSIKSNYNLNAENMRSVQFYVSSELVLYREVKNSDSVHILNGKLLFKSNNTTEKIIIKPNTPCVFENEIGNNGDILSISFEKGKNRNLYFIKNEYGVYSLAAKTWDSDNDNIGMLSYNDKYYFTGNGNTYLTIKSKTFRKIKNKQRVIKGRKISDKV